ncbi:DNA mismatch repair protein [Gracilibacillus halophilus YIM-C55.5]|uniref:DNA mismatch repair protein MutL n=1 Tax=Gracilibacillus halophilus YIM-C55.5 TaxID=1308866 RepID=N4WQE3_9BACI|nr:DNA mismatch repair endonuclease MutL [Gracilibacillus halophilus]ENH96675.1 DNA mismatch repair protein [Gracilibacillus halophilus YIM-C55.5]
MDIIELPDHLSNRIAAGEVVERPASVVKELVENSIDAGSSSIRVEVTEAGLQSIKVIDDGHGIQHDQCHRAFLRHATSKIRNEDDLFHVQSLGFRGEALASIAAVSRLQLKTSTGEQAGTSITLEGGRVVNEDRSDARRGTTITVNDLFYNTPARLKYMKTVHTELGHITDIMNRVAVAHPNIRFELIHNEKQMFQTTGRGDMLQIISAIYGRKVAQQMIPVEKTTLDYNISGYIAMPEINRSSRNFITTTVNGRFVKSIALAKAITNGYHTLLPIGRQPIVIINIEMDPILIDVNVHPTKLEVRFSKEKALVEAIEDMIVHALKQQTLIPSGTNQKVSKQPSVQSSFAFDQNTAQKERTTDQSEVREPIVDQWELNEPFNEMEQETGFEDEGSQPSFSEQGTVSNNEDRFFDHDDAPIYGHDPEATHAGSQVERVPVMYPIGQHHGTYILAQNETGLYIIDQHAAQERIKYEFFRDRIGFVDREVQELLVPLTFDFTPQEALIIEEYHDEFQKVGLFFEQFGQYTYIIRSHPRWFPEGEEEEMIRQMVDQLVSTSSINVSKLREDAAILMSCKRSIKANHYLNQEDMKRLLDDLRTCEDPFTCPHGRPIIIQFSSYELEKMFKRVM